MTAPITTGSGLERAFECRASNVLDRIYTGDSIYSTRGVAVHAYLERISNGMDPAESLELVDEEHRAACDGLDLDGLNLAQLSAEVAMAIHLPSGAARLLGQGLDRNYQGVDDDEVPLTIDLAGVDLERRVGKVADHKYGWSRRTAARDNWQLKGAAYALATIYDLDEVDGALLLHRDGQPTRPERAVFDAADLLVMRGELGELHQRVIGDRAAHAAGQRVTPSEGPWCSYCPSFWECPAKTAAIRAALAIDDGPVTSLDAGATLKAIAKAKRILSAVETRIYAQAAQTPMLIDYDPDTQVETWLGGTTKQGNEVLDGQIGIDAAAEVLQVPAAELAAFARELAPPDTITKKSLKEAVRKRAKAIGKKIGEAEEEILDKIRASGGAKKPTKHEVGEYTVQRMPPGEAA